MAKGILYIMTSAIPNLVKIGKTETKNFEQRMKVLEQNGYWNVTGLKRHFAIEVDDYSEKEKMLDDIFSNNRIPNTELFVLDVGLITKLLDSFEGTQIYPKEEKEETRNNVPKKKSNKKQRKSPFSFSSVNIPIGAILTHKECDNIKVKVVSDNKVEYQNNVYSMSRLVEELIKNDNRVKKHALPIQGTLYFLYENELLTDRRNRIEKEKTIGEQ